MGLLEASETAQAMVAISGLKTNGGLNPATQAVPGGSAWPRPESIPAGPSPWIRPPPPARPFQLCGPAHWRKEPRPERNGVEPALTVSAQKPHLPWLRLAFAQRPEPSRCKPELLGSSPFNAPSEISAAEIGFPRLEPRSLHSVACSQMRCDGASTSRDKPYYQGINY